MKTGAGSAARRRTQRDDPFAAFARDVTGPAPTPASGPRTPPARGRRAVADDPFAGFGTEAAPATPASGPRTPPARGRRAAADPFAGFGTEAAPATPASGPRTPPARGRRAAADPFAGFGTEAVNPFAIGDKVRRGNEIGTVLQLAEPRPGWHRALVQWPDSEQFVDVDKLSLVAHAPAAHPARDGGDPFAGFGLDAAPAPKPVPRPAAPKPARPAPSSARPASSSSAAPRTPTAEETRRAKVIRTILTEEGFTDRPGVPDVALKLAMDCVGEGVKDDRFDPERVRKMLRSTVKHFVEASQWDRPRLLSILEAEGLYHVKIAPAPSAPRLPEQPRDLPEKGATFMVGDRVRVFDGEFKGRRGTVVGVIRDTGGPMRPAREVLFDKTPRMTKQPSARRVDTAVLVPIEGGPYLWADAATSAPGIVTAFAEGLSGAHLSTAGDPFPTPADALARIMALGREADEAGAWLQQKGRWSRPNEFGGDWTRAVTEALLGNGMSAANAAGKALRASTFAERAAALLRELGGGVPPSESPPSLAATPSAERDEIVAYLKREADQAERAGAEFTAHQLRAFADRVAWRMPAEGLRAAVVGQLNLLGLLRQAAHLEHEEVAPSRPPPSRAPASSAAPSRRAEPPRHAPASARPPSEQAQAVPARFLPGDRVRIVGEERIYGPQRNGRVGTVTRVYADGGRVDTRYVRLDPAPRERVAKEPMMDATHLEPIQGAAPVLFARGAETARGLLSAFREGLAQHKVPSLAGDAVFPPSDTLHRMMSLARAADEEGALGAGRRDWGHAVSKGLDGQGVWAAFLSGRALARSGLTDRALALLSDLEAAAALDSAAAGRAPTPSYRAPSVREPAPMVVLGRGDGPLSVGEVRREELRQQEAAARADRLVREQREVIEAATGWVDSVVDDIHILNDRIREGRAVTEARRDLAASGRDSTARARRGSPSPSRSCRPRCSASSVPPRFARPTDAKTLTTPSSPTSTSSSTAPRSARSRRSSPALASSRSAGPRRSRGVTTGRCSSPRARRPAAMCARNRSTPTVRPSTPSSLRRRAERWTGRHGEHRSRLGFARRTSSWATTGHAQRSSSSPRRASTAGQPTTRKPSGSRTRSKRSWTTTARGRSACGPSCASSHGTRRRRRARRPRRSRRAGPSPRAMLRKRRRRPSPRPRASMAR